MLKKKGSKQKVLLLFLALSCLFLFSACNKNAPIILFNKEPITRETLLNNSTQFVKGKRFYYIFITQKPLKVNSIRVRIYKRDEKANMCLSKMAYSNDFRLAQDNIYYYSDYFVMNEVGYYCMMVFAADNLKQPLAIADFQIVDY